MACASAASSSSSAPLRAGGSEHDSQGNGNLLRDVDWRNGNLVINDDQRHRYPNVGNLIATSGSIVGMDPISEPALCTPSAQRAGSVARSGNRKCRFGVPGLYQYVLRRGYRRVWDGGGINSLAALPEGTYKVWGETYGLRRRAGPRWTGCGGPLPDNVGGGGRSPRSGWRGWS